VLVTNASLPRRMRTARFSSFTFSHEALRPGEDGVDLRVLFGTWQRSETLPRDEAIRTEPYRILFNINGHFKRPSVIGPNRGRGRRA